MKKNVMYKNLLQSIRKSLGRYLAIVAIIALGAGIFVGLRSSKWDMVVTGQNFMDHQNMFDLQLMTPYGWNKDDVDTIAHMEYVDEAEGVISLDAIVEQESRSDAEQVFRFYNIPSSVNKVALRGGRMPEHPNECLADGYQFDDKILGSTIKISDVNDETTLDSFAYKEFTVVGYVASPLYMDMNRGNTTIGNGNIASYLYIPDEALDVNYYSSIHITIPGNYKIYTDSYNQAMEDSADNLKPLLKPIAEKRFQDVKQDAMKQYRDGLQELENGKQEFDEKKEESEQALADAESELKAGEAELEQNRVLIESGEQQLADAKEMMHDSRAVLQDAKAKLAEEKAAAYAQLAEANTALLDHYKTVNTSLREVDAGLLQITTGLAELNAGIGKLESGLEQIDSGISQLNTLIALMDTGIKTAQSAMELAQQAPQIDQETIDKFQAQIEQYQTQQEEYKQQKAELEANRAEYDGQLQDLYQKRTELQTQQTQLEETKSQLDAAQIEIDNGLLELENSQTAADNQFAVAEAQLESGQYQIEVGQTEIQEKEKELEEGKKAIAQGELDLKEGWKSYESGKKEAESALADAKSELEKAERQLADAKSEINKMTETDTIILDRNMNMGYASLNSNSDIVAGVSKVFPVFFLLIAALVCITTMTRMVNEERTQIGTLKALGYSNFAIISKYLLYAGSGALLGCGLGVLLGSIIFPVVMWKAYCIMLYITPNIEILFNWKLCIIVVASYTFVMLAVTWSCCRAELREVPAELIRPKAPASGKQIFLEKFKLWEKLNFLNKVAIRNVFRYHQRFAMMLIGIGGCTALLVTGFGLRDSIVNIVDYQYEDITSYDMEVYFSDAQDESEKQQFENRIGDGAKSVLFFHQSSATIDYDHHSKDVRLIASGNQLKDYVHFVEKNQEIPLPGKNEVLLSVGTAEALHVHKGDEITMRNADMEELTLKVSGVFKNYIYNYAIVNPETIEAQLGELPGQQMAFVQAAPDADVHELGAKISGMSNVMNVTINDDVANMVGSMMEALNLVVITVVICAGLLAIIVLYNLTNININERIREIATIKVLGFQALETSAYVFKENIALTVMGILVGLPAGHLLLKFVMDKIRIDMVWFQARVTPFSYFLSMLLTILSGVAVMGIFYFKLEKIDMAEALKSVE